MQLINKWKHLPGMHTNKSVTNALQWQNGITRVLTSLEPTDVIMFNCTNKKHVICKYICSAYSCICRTPPCICQSQSYTVSKLYEGNRSESAKWWTKVIEIAEHTSLSLRSVKSSSRSSLNSPSSGSSVKPGLSAQFVHRVASISSRRPRLPVGRRITLSSGGIRIQVSIFRVFHSLCLQERGRTSSGSRFVGKRRKLSLRNFLCNVVIEIAI